MSVNGPLLEKQNPVQQPTHQDHVAAPWRARTVLFFSTTAFTLCFAVWVIFSIIGIPIKQMLHLSDTQFGLLVATPVLTGALTRLPLGMLTDRFGGRRVFTLLMLLIVTPIYLLSAATTYWQFLALGLLVGVAGGSFTVGVGYVARWFPQEQRGLALGIFGAGGTGTALTTFIAPLIVAGYGWKTVPTVYAAVILLMSGLFWFCTHTDPNHQSSESVPILAQLALLKDMRVWRYCQYYSVVFGGFVALSLWLTKYFINEYGLTLKSAALLTSLFALPSGGIRAIGGWFADRFGPYRVIWWVMWLTWVCLFLLSYPQTDMTIHGAHGQLFHLHIGLAPWMFMGLLLVVGIAWSFGSAATFKFVANDFPDNIGIVSGLVGMIGALGGFVLPILFGAAVELTGINSSIFMLLYGATCVSLIWMHFTFKQRHPAPQ